MSLSRPARCKPLHRPDDRPWSSPGVTGPGIGVRSRKRIGTSELSLPQGFRLLSAYQTANGERIWAITEADRSATAILLPEEYEQVEGRDAHARMNGEGILEQMCGETPHQEGGATATGGRPAAFLLTSRA
jgi:hypothetical protein